MTFINHMIKQAKADPPPKELTIRPNQVMAYVEHILGCHPAAHVGYDLNMLRIYVLNQLLLGRVKLLGVPVRVIGQ